MRIRLIICLIAVPLLLPTSAWGCPECAEGIRQQVRAGIFNDDFAYHLVATAAPFGVFLGTAALIHFGSPSMRRSAPTGRDRDEP